MKIEDVIDLIRSRSNDRGLMATLRRGLNDSTQEMAWPYLAEWSPGPGFRDETQRKIWATVVGAVATLAPDEFVETEQYKGGLGSVMRAIAVDGAKDKNDAIKSYEARFRRMSASPDVLDLCNLVVGVILTASRKRVKVNCQSLFWDLKNWVDAEKRERIRIRWAEDFYRAPAPDAPTADAAKPEVSE